MDVQGQSLYLLSPYQRKIWRGRGETGQGFNRLSCKVTGEVDFNILRARLKDLATRNDLLRSSLVKRPEWLYPGFAFTGDTGACDLEITHRTDAADEEEAVKDGDGLFSVQVSVLREGEYRVDIRASEMISDISSLLLVVRRLFDDGGIDKYGERSTTEEVSFLQYADWHQSLISSPSDEAGAFWKDYFSTPAPEWRFPFEGFAKSAAKEYSLLKSTIGSDVLMRIAQVLKQADLSLPAYIRACVITLIYKYTHSQRIRIFERTNGRKFDVLQDTFGPIDTPIPFEMVIDEEVSFVNNALSFEEGFQKAFDFSEYLDWDQLKTDDPDLPVILDFVDATHRYTNAGEVKVDLIRIDNSARDFKLKLEVLHLADSIEIQLCFDHRYFEYSSLERVLLHLTELIGSAFANINTPVKHLRVFSHLDAHAIMNVFNRAGLEMKPETRFVDLFSGAVASFPDNCAVEFEGKKYTYRELDRMTNQLSAYLVRQYDLTPGKIVAILGSRSDKLIISILAVLKAGCAFLVLDPGLPVDRLNYLLEDAKPGVLLSYEQIGQDLKFGPETNYSSWEDALFSEMDSQTPAAVTVPGTASIEYVIYTSGSSGNPKGVLIRCGSLSNYIIWANKFYFDNQQGYPTALFTPVAVDLTFTSIFATLARGDKIHVLGDEPGIESILSEIFRPGSGIACVKLTPTHIRILKMLDLRQTEVRSVIVGGEELTRDHVDFLYKLNPDVKIYNEYGPTEITVACSCIRVVDPQKISIGRPIDNTGMFILNTLGDLSAVFEPGEIAVTGVGLAEGYLNQVEQTAEKFVVEPHLGGIRLYKTGDVGRWMANGEIEYLGRSDRQVKINGHRVELAELERLALGLPKIKDVLVITSTDKFQNKQLTLYYVSEDAITKKEVYDYLRDRLPEYSMPSRLIRLTRIPVAFGGKIDWKGLSILSEEESDHNYTPAANLVEETMVEVWKDLLGCGNIGVNDNFLFLGGDSIKAIQVSSGMYRRSFKVSVKDILKYLTIARIAPFVTPVAKAEEEVITQEPFRLIPVQKDFFGNKSGMFDDHTQIMLLTVNSDLSLQTANDIFLKIIDHHDALRMVFSYVDGEWTQSYRDRKDDQIVDEIGLGVGSAMAEGIESVIRHQSRKINILTGPLIKTTLCRDKGALKLLIMIHHLAMDGVSWRILLEDLEVLLRQANAGRKLELPAKSISYKKWSDTVYQDYKNNSFGEDRAFWIRQSQHKAGRIEIDHPDEAYFQKDEQVLKIRLNEDDTDLLVSRGYSIYNVNLNELILAALALGVKDKFGIDTIPITMEGHGRGAFTENADVSRTIGWFTTDFPIVFFVNNEWDLDRLIQEIKERVREVPNGGIGFGLWRHSEDFRRIADCTHRPQICLNYMGQYDTDLNSDQLTFDDNVAGYSIAPEWQKGMELEIIAYVLEKKLNIAIKYSSQQFNAGTVNDFARMFEEHIHKIVAHTAGQKEKKYTPSDLTGIRMSIDDLNSLFD